MWRATARQDPSIAYHALDSSQHPANAPGELMYRLWAVIKPLLDAIEPEVIVEVGSDAGHQTRLLAEYCASSEAQLHVIDPLPKYDVSDFFSQFASPPTMHLALSLEALPAIPSPSAVLIDGDHNYYTVRSELEVLLKSARSSGARFPLVFLHDIGWPYGRRDLYYAPETIPDDQRHPWRRAGLHPGSPEPQDDEAFNAHLANAVPEGTPRNGVLTAVEDFHQEHPELEFCSVGGIHGLGILFERSTRNDRPDFDRLLHELQTKDLASKLLGATESDRLRAHIALAGEKRRAALETERRRKLESEMRGLRGASASAQAQAAELARKLEMSESAERDALRRSAALSEALTVAAAERREAGRRTQELRAEVSSLRTDLRAAKGAHLKAQKEIAQLSRELANTKRSLERLRNRRIVRIALRIASLAQPIFKAVRAIRTRSPKAASEHREEAVMTAEGESASPTTDLVTRLMGQEVQPPPVTIIVPVYNAPAALRVLLTSLDRHVAAPDQVLVIDDASTDPSVAEILESVATDERFQVARNPANLGFTGTVNQALQRCRTDVVVLNSDTEVGPKWLRNLQIAAYKDERTAIVSPISDNAGVFSAPLTNRPNPLPPEMSWDEAARRVAKSSAVLRPNVPTGHGFCMYVRRDALDQVGEFDQAAFPRGYGEETDFSLRAREKGWRCVLDDRTYVRHLEAASFGADRSSLLEAGRSVIDSRYPRYSDEVQELKTSTELAKIRIRVEHALAQPGDVRPRVLSVLHDGGGGTPKTNRDLMLALDDEFEVFTLRSSRSGLTCERPASGEVEWQQALEPVWRATEFERADFRIAYTEVLDKLDIDVLHIRHLLGHTFDLPKVARALRIPVVLSLHDFYLSCPTIHLLDENGTHCGGICTVGPGPCPTPSRLGQHPPLKHAWIHEWRKQVAALFRFVDVAVTTSPQTVETFRRSFPDSSLPPMEIIEHGRDFPQRIHAAVPPQPGSPLRVLLLGNIGRNKGGDVVAAIRELDRDGEIEFHFLGDVAPQYQDLGELHGTYSRDDVLHKIQDARPNVVAILSTWPETYCHTLTEAWAAGVPVVATSLGAVEHRIVEHGGGWLVDVHKPKEIYQHLLDIRSGRADWEGRRGEASAARIRPVSAMAEDYRSVYQRLLSGQLGIEPAMVQSEGQ